jgi:hypothetical protein
VMGFPFLLDCASLELAIEEPVPIFVMKYANRENRNMITMLS